MNRTGARILTPFLGWQRGHLQLTSMRLGLSEATKRDYSDDREVIVSAIEMVSSKRESGGALVQGLCSLPDKMLGIFSQTNIVRGKWKQNPDIDGPLLSLARVSSAAPTEVLYGNRKDMLPCAV